MILAIVFGLAGLGALIVLIALWYKRRKAAQKRRENQRARMLAIGDFSQTHLPQTDGAADLPHPRPGFANLPWAGGSLESLGTNLRSTPFIWPLGSGSNANSPIDRRSVGASPHDGNSLTGGDSGATGISTARPGLDSRATGSSGVLRRLRSARYGNGSGFGFGFPFGGNGYRSLGDSDDNTTPSSGPPNTRNNSGSGLGHTVNHSDSSSSAMHKSPLPPRYQNQHASQNSHGSNGSRVSALGTTGADPVPLMPMSGGAETLTRPGPVPMGPRPSPGITRPSFGREDTGGSVWEVPPTYTSLRRQTGLRE